MQSFAIFNPIWHAYCFQIGMNSEMNSTDVGSSPAANHALILLDSSGVRAMRDRLHELANIFTGVLIAGGLLSRYLDAGPLRHYATDISEGSERGSALVRELRSQLLAACGEEEVLLRGNTDDSRQGQ